MSEKTRAPRWVSVRKEEVCHACQMPIPLGAKAMFYPIGRVIICKRCQIKAEQHEDARQ